jgi:hypothetical protein
MNLWSLIPLASSVIYGVLLLMLLLQVKTRVNRIFTIFLLSATVWSVFAFILCYNPSASTKQLVFWNNLLIVSIVCTGVAYYHFLRAFTGKKAGIIVYLGYGLSIAVLILSQFGWVVRDAYISNGRVYHDIGPWVYILIPLILPPLLAGAWVLFKQLRKTQNLIDMDSCQS